jgi:predicted O-methyltransferase YrrM
MGARLRSLRRATKPLRDRLRPRPRRKRWHVLGDLLRRHGPASGAVVVEVGTRHGRTAAHLLRICPRIDRLYAIDRTAPDPGCYALAGLERARFVLGDSAECAAAFPDASVDLVFLDADHAEAAVLRDLAAWAPKLRPGGVLAGHDYGAPRHPGVRRAVDRFFSERGLPVRVEADRVWWALAPGLP